MWERSIASLVNKLRKYEHDKLTTIMTKHYCNNIKTDNLRKFLRLYKTNICM